MQTAFEKAIHEIAEERIKQAQGLKSLNLPYDCSHPDTPDSIKYLVLSEEMGEVAKTIVDYTSTPTLSTVGRTKLKEELTQVAAVTIAWLEALHAEDNNEVSLTSIP